MVTLLWDLFYYDIVEMAVGILGDAASGGHQAVMTDLLDPLSSKELPRRRKSQSKEAGFRNLNFGC